MSEINIPLLVTLHEEISERFTHQRVGKAFSLMRNEEVEAENEFHDSVRWKSVIGCPDSTHEWSRPDTEIPIVIDPSRAFIQ